MFSDFGLGYSAPKEYSSDHFRLYLYTLKYRKHPVLVGFRVRAPRLSDGGPFGSSFVSRICFFWAFRAVGLNPSILNDYTAAAQNP